MKYLLLVLPAVLQAQSIEKTILKEGNTAYQKKDYAAAASFYKKALADAKFPDVAKYNLGNATHELDQLEESIALYSDVAKNTENPQLKAKAYHNQGNSYYKKQAYDKSIEAYKKALKLSPNDAGTKKNIQLAKKMLQQMQNQQQNEQQNQSGQNSPPDRPQPNQQKMSEEEAKRLLQLMDEQDKKTQEKIRKGTPKNGRITKDW